VQKRVGTRRARIAVLVPALVLLGVLAHVAGATSPPDHQITLCHATDSYTNPYVVITVDVASVRFAGHEGHDGPIFFPAIAKHTKWGDIIPPASNDGTRAVTPKNWSAEGQSIWADGCAATAPVSTTTNEPTTTTGPGEVTTTTDAPGPGDTTTTEPATTTTLSDS
jgi:hypothetical protein